MKYSEYIDLEEARIKKIVNRKGQIRKTKTAGKKGKKVDSSGAIVTQSAQEKKNKRIGKIKKKRTMKKVTATKKKRSTRFASMGRAKRKKSNIRDNRKG
jgi:hypothetical protein